MTSIKLYSAIFNAMITFAVVYGLFFKGYPYTEELSSALIAWGWFILIGSALSGMYHAKLSTSIDELKLGNIELEAFKLKNKTFVEFESGWFIYIRRAIQRISLILLVIYLVTIDHAVLALFTFFIWSINHGLEKVAKKQYADYLLDRN